jgi:hypothetical protein
LRRERYDIRRARVFLQAGDRSGALAILRALERPAPRRQVAEQLALMLILDTTFRCDRLDIDELRVRDCLTRRSRVWPSGGGRGSPAPEAERCVGCPVGASFAAQLPGFEPPPSRMAPVVLSIQQRIARDRAGLGMLGRARGEDPLTTVARMTPDDLTDWGA